MSGSSTTGGSVRFVTSAGGVQLAVREYGDPASATQVVLLHGFPDDQTMWEPVVESLPADWHVITYDARGAGGSSRPRTRSAYRTELLVEDLVAVVRATVPDDARFHLVGHDWGSCAGWEVLAAETWDHRLAGRLASFTSASGPSFDHLATRLSTWPGRLRLLPQLLHSWYVYVFLIPLLPELTTRLTLPLVRAFFERVDPTVRLLGRGPDVTRNAIPSINLYRANVGARMRAPRPWRTSVPVLLVVALRDGFVTPRALEGLEARCRHLDRVEVDEGHWVPRARPAEFAAAIRQAVDA